LEKEIDWSIVVFTPENAEKGNSFYWAFICR
jgi:hypothetical protein